jgi:NADH-quinone oxidoreductase subunit L
MVPLAPLAGCLACTFLSLRGDRKLAHIPAITALLISALFAICLIAFGAQGDTEQGVTYSGFRYLNVGSLTLDISLKVDTLCLSLLTVVTSISAMIAIYSKDYMHNDPGYARYFAVFCGFVFCMTMLVLSHNLLMMYAFWEGVGTCSYLLIGFWFRKPSAAQAAIKAFLVNRVADCAFLIGILLLAFAIGKTEIASASFFARLDFDIIFKAVPFLVRDYPELLTTIGLLLMVGAIGKSAQFPFHVWLPDAMEGPTPVSALIHAATMVTAGVYLMARLSPMLVETPTVLSTVAWLGGITAFIAAWMALFQDDLKRVLAYSTVSQLGYLFMALGAGAIKDLMAVAVVAAMFHLITHAFFKALLFLSAGNVMHAMGDVIDMRRFSGLNKVLPWTNILFGIGAAALAGLFPLAGFWSKDTILSLLADASSDGEYGTQFSVLLGIGFITALMTAIYTSRAYFRTFYGAEKLPEEAGHHAHEASWTMLAPMAVLSVGAVLVGVLLGPTHAIANFLGNHSEHHEQMWVIVASTIVAFAGVGIGYFLSKMQPSTATSGAMVAFADFGRNRLYIDWLYNVAIVKPIEWFADLLGWFDTVVIDGLAMQIANVPRLCGLLGQRVQNGRLPGYTYITAIGIAALALWIATR